MVEQIQKDQNNEVSIVSSSYTRVEPFAMMVKFRDTFVTFLTMLWMLFNKRIAFVTFKLENIKLRITSLP